MSRPFHEALLRGHQAEREWVETMRDDGAAVAHGIKDSNCRGAKCLSPDAVALVRVEIKQRDLRFTCPEDFPYDTAFLRNMAGESEEPTLPMLYVIRSAPTRAWVWVFGPDRDESWTVSTVRDNTRGHCVTTLSCPKSCLRHSDSLLPWLIRHDLLRHIDGDTSAFRPASDPRANPRSPPSEGGGGTTEKKTNRHMG